MVWFGLLCEVNTRYNIRHIGMKRMIAYHVFAWGVPTVGVIIALATEKVTSGVGLNFCFIVSVSYSHLRSPTHCIQHATLPFEALYLPPVC